MILDLDPAPAFDGWLNAHLRAGVVPEGLLEGERWEDLPNAGGLVRNYERVAAAYVVSEFPDDLTHSSAVWVLNRVGRLEGLNIHHEVCIRRADDNLRPRADIVVFPQDRSPIWLIEWKTRLSSASDVARAVAQLHRYADRAGRPCRLIAAGYGATDSHEGDVEVLSPTSLLRAFQLLGRSTVTEESAA